MANFERSVEFLAKVKEYDSHIYTKSGLMVGLGETKEQVTAVMRELRKVNCDILTIGQYLRPSKEQLKVSEYVRPEVFEEYKAIGYELGFKYVASGPYVRSSFNAQEFFDYINDRKE
jgi:lipoic acid synthetase